MACISSWNTETFLLYIIIFTFFSTMLCFNSYLRSHCMYNASLSTWLQSLAFFFSFLWRPCAHCHPLQASFLVAAKAVMPSFATRWHWYLHPSWRNSVFPSTEWVENDSSLQGTSWHAIDLLYQYMNAFVVFFCWCSVTK